jgi:hypothetical protein
VEGEDAELFGHLFDRNLARAAATRAASLAPVSRSTESSALIRFLLQVRNSSMRETSEQKSGGIT